MHWCHDVCEVRDTLRRHFFSTSMSITCAVPLALSPPRKPLAPALSLTGLKGRKTEQDSRCHVQGSCGGSVEKR